MARVALVNLPFQGRIAAVAQTSVGPPMGLAYLAAVLEAADHRVTIVDANALGLSLGQAVERVHRFRPDVVGTTAATPSIDLAARLGRQVAAVSGAPLVVGGPHTTALPLQTLEEHPSIQVAVIGEGEGIADALVRALCGDGALSDVPSIAFRDGGSPRLTDAAPPPASLDSLPFPARSLLPNDLYRTIDASPMTCITAMRGCPAGCSYCNVPRLAGQRVRRRSPQDVVAEMQQVLTRWNVPYVSFLDDTFTTSRAWVIRLCEEAHAAGLPGRVAWSCLTRPDCVDAEMLLAMKNAGMTRIEFGIESGSPRVLERLGKGVTLARIRAAFALARELDLVTLGFAMLNVPDETPAEMEETAQEVLRLDPDFLQLSFCTPYPGTALFDECVERGLLLTEDWSDYRFLRTPVIRNEALTPRDLERIHRDILRRFYLRPGKAARYAAMIARRPAIARSLTRSTARGLLHLARRGHG